MGLKWVLMVGKMGGHQIWHRMGLGEGLGGGRRARRGGAAEEVRLCVAAGGGRPRTPVVRGRRLPQGGTVDVRSCVRGSRLRGDGCDM